MSQRAIRYNALAGGEGLAGTVTAENDTWNTSVARQFAAAAIRERLDFETWAAFDVNTITAETVDE